MGDSSCLRPRTLAPCSKRGVATAGSRACFDLQSSKVDCRASSMSLAEIEQKVFALTDEERRQFAAWFYRNEDRILPADSEEDEVADEDLSPEVMAELVR